MLALLDVRLSQWAAVPVGRGYDHADGQVVFLGEYEIALVVGGDAHNDARAVCEQDVVAHEYGNALAVELVDAVCAGEDAGFFFFGG